MILCVDAYSRLNGEESSPTAKFILRELRATTIDVSTLILRF